MAATPTHKNFETILGAVVDHEDMIVRNCAIITEGVARGHNMLVDRKTLEQMKELCEEFDGGLKVKMDHYSGFDAIVGSLKNFRIKGKKLLADLQLLKNHPASPRVLEMAENIPDTFGLSASFSGDPEEIDGLAFARVTEIYSADLVDQPAANPDGLFSAAVGDNSPLSKDKLPTQTPTQSTMSTQAPQAPQAPSTSELSERIDKLATNFETLLDRLPKPEVEVNDETKLSELSVKELRGLIQEETSKQAVSLGWKPGESNGNTPEPQGVTGDPQGGADGAPAQEPEVKSFEAIIRNFVAGGMTKAEAVSTAMKNPENHELHRKWLESGGAAHFTL